MMHLPLPSDSTAKPGSVAATRKMRWWYEALADFMLANPTALQNDIAAHFGRTASTISIVINTDAFKAYFRQRRAAFQSDLSEGVKQKLMNVADVSLDMMLEKLEKKKDSIPLDMLLKTNESVLKALGYGQTGGGSAVQVNVNTNAATVAPAVTLADLEAARVAFRNSQAAALPPPTSAPAGEEASVVEGEFTETSTALGRGATATSIDDLV